MRLGLCAILVLIVGGCAAASAAAPVATAIGGAGGQAAGPAIEDLPFTIEIVTAKYGKLIIRTRPDATCRARATLPSGNVVLAADFVIDQRADAGGQAIWAYRAAIAGAASGTGRYAISCASGGRSVDAAVDFDVP